MGTCILAVGHVVYPAIVVALVVVALWRLRYGVPHPLIPLVGYVVLVILFRLAVPDAGVCE